MGLKQLTLLALCGIGWTQNLELLPPPGQNTEFQTQQASTWEVESSPKIIYIENDFASVSDTDGLTLIPPTGYEFAQTFRDDLEGLTGDEWELKRVDTLPNINNGSGIFLGAYTGNSTSVVYENGIATSEGYELDVSTTGVFIGGTGARGMWWGTRSLLQYIMVLNGSVPAVSFTDAPAYSTRGFMLDAGRKWYDLGFLKELCSFASFFKASEFHYHLSDNYPLNRGQNETWQDVYSHFSLLPEDESLLGILHGRENETLSRSEFSELQSHCASRGVTVIPEIEAPGHCLYLTKWKPELALEKRDLLNLTHPDTIPTVQRIWSEFLPWFEVKEVHVGADEYDPELADDYITFVNEMHDYIGSNYNKSIRIWGTNEPSDNLTINPDILIQHWQYGESDPEQVVADGHEIINSQDWWAYTSLKNDHAPILPARYPQFFNESRVLNFADEEGWQWAPADFNPFNSSMQLDDGEILNRGSIMAAWNDNGPDATTQLEAYYSMRRGIALSAARAWAGRRGPELNPASVAPSIDFLGPLAPAQNLDRRLPSESNSTGGDGAGPLVSWTRSESDDDEHVSLGYGSKGMNYTLELEATGPFSLTGPDNTLSLDFDGSLVFNADGWEYPLRSVSETDAVELDPGHPGRIWVNMSSSTHDEVKVTSLPANITIMADVEHGCIVWVNDEFAGRFEVFVYGGRNTKFSWSQMAFVAPLENVTGSGLQRLSVAGAMRIPSGDAEDSTEGPETDDAGSWGVNLVTLGVVGVGSIAALL